MKRSRSLVLAGAVMLGATLLSTGTGSAAPVAPAPHAPAPPPGPGRSDRGGPENRFGPDDRGGRDNRFGPENRFGPDDRGGRDDRFGPVGRVGRGDDGPDDNFGEADPTATGPDTARDIGPEMRHQWGADHGEGFVPPAGPAARPLFGR